MTFSPASLGKAPQLSGILPCDIWLEDIWPYDIWPRRTTSAYMATTDLAIPGQVGSEERLARESGVSPLGKPLSISACECATLYGASPWLGVTSRALSPPATAAPAAPAAASDLSRHIWLICSRRQCHDEPPSRALAAYRSFSGAIFHTPVYEPRH